MIRVPTLFVIGAGAGFDIGMPLGIKLGTMIGDTLRFADRFAGRSDRIADLVEQALLDYSGRANLDYSQIKAAGGDVAGAAPYMRSIDNYLHTHKDSEEVKLCGKMAIVACILGAERDSALWVDTTLPAKDRQFRDRTKVEGSWLADLISILSEGVIAKETLEDIFKNVTIINFNYDRCIEHFLFRTIQVVFRKNEKEAADLINQKLRIFHPYGTVGSLPWQGKPSPIEFGEVIGHHTLMEIWDRIRTYNEEVEQGEEMGWMRHAIHIAKRIVFLGFHFHPQNMELITTDLKERPWVCGTTFQRSGSDILLIRERISAMIGNKGASGRDYVATAGLDCNGLFKEYGTLLAS